MYSFREENCKSKKSHKNLPSFSSTLLDEIYRSIDEKTEDFKGYREKPMRSRQAKLMRENDDEAIASFRRACLVEKWMEKEENEKLIAAKMRPPLFPDNDLLFFSSTSSSSDSSGALSSSDTEFFGSSQTKPKVSCFSTRPKPVRTTVSSRDNNSDDKLNHRQDEDLIKYKSRALKIYANLKKVKQPISPGGKLTSFINSLFSNNGGNHVKKSKNVEKNNKGFHDLKSPSAAVSSSSACSSASSFSRSCLSKYSPKSREKMRSSNGIQRTVRFHPVSVIVDEDCRPCGQKSLYEEDSDQKCRRPPLPPNANLTELKFSKMEKINREVEEVAQRALKGINDFSMFRKAHDDEDEDDEDCDGISDSSSDLFELDHLSLFGNNRFCEELPVYETTRLDNNRAIVSCLIR